MCPIRKLFCFLEKKSFCRSLWKTEKSEEGKEKMQRENKTGKSLSFFP
jgi:hypothetical protein